MEHGRRRGEVESSVGGRQQSRRRRQGAEAVESGDSSWAVRFRMAAERPNDPANAANRSGKIGGGHQESMQP